MPTATRFDARFDETRVVDFAEMTSIVASGSSQIADARGPGRFTGEEAEPRAGMRSGHMRGAKNLHYAMLSEGGFLKSNNALTAIIESHSIDLTEPLVTSCGSGVTAAVIILAHAVLGYDHARLYDGSWAEWGGRDDTEIVTGP